ncbi:MAG TPA: AraC family transcriptional regulator [Edaphocola sp.]|nr:AraC family transcriptional regulator [Edaphocola sp.]
MKLYIKNMVCLRCVMAVEEIFKRLSVPVTAVRLGEVELPGGLSDDEFIALDKALEAIGFKRIDDRRVRIIEKIKNCIITLVHHTGDPLTVNVSDWLSAELHLDYTYLSRLFSEVEGITIEKYLITQKIEKVKELLLYDELTLSEIAWQMGYSSVAHLSGQFKKQTGLTPSFYKRMKAAKRQSIEDI